MVLYHTKQINSMLSWVCAVIDHHKMTSICEKWKICVVGESLFEGDIIIKRFKGQFFMIVGIATTMAMKMTKIPWRGFGCSSKLLLSPSSAVEDLEHPDELLLRPRVGAFTSSPPLPEWNQYGLSISLFYTCKNFSMLTSQEHKNYHQKVQKVEIECKMLKWKWLTGESRKHNKTKWRTSEEKVTTF